MEYEETCTLNQKIMFLFFDISFIIFSTKDIYYEKQSTATYLYVAVLEVYLQFFTTIIVLRLLLSI